MTRLAKAAALALALTLTTAGASTAGPLWEFDRAGHSFTNDNWDFATSFTALADLTVSGLGWYADPVNGQEGRFARRPDGTVERPA